MAHTARSEEDKKEYFDPPEVLDRKATQLAGWIGESKHMIAFTGAGISTAAGIPDFRSGMNTKVETGPGAWELKAHGKSRNAAIKVKSTVQAIPTPTHMMLVKLMEEGLLKAVISQNCDGLHRRSGLPVRALFELHGNTNVEKCRKCKKEYLRDFRVKGLQRMRHDTGRTCDDPQCGGKLKDTIIHFGESLPGKTLEKSCEHSEMADLCLAMGSSLTVTPAADIPETVGLKQRLVIVNLQATPLDGIAALRVNAKCDEFARLLMEKLQLEIPQFHLKRRLRFKTMTQTKKVVVEQLDAEGNPFSYLKHLEFRGVVSKPCVPEKEPLECVMPRTKGEIVVELVFQAHYGEPNISLRFQVVPEKNSVVDVSLSYAPHTGEWTVNRSDQPEIPIIIKADKQEKPVAGSSRAEGSEPVRLVTGSSKPDRPVVGSSKSAEGVARGSKPVAGRGRTKTDGPISGSSKPRMAGSSRPDKPVASGIAPAQPKTDISEDELSGELAKLQCKGLKFQQLITKS